MSLTSVKNEMDAVAAPPAKPLEIPSQISENGLEVLRRRYLRKGLDGKPIETVPEMFWRVASNVALPERAYGGEDLYLETSEEFYDLLTTLRFFPNSPTFTGAGTPLGQLAACFVLAIDDDMGKDSSEGIFNTLRNAALIQQTGGGNGFSFSRLRPRGDSVNSSAGVASGPVGFLKVYDAAFGEIAQGGCLTPESLVFTGNGLLRLDELVDPARSGWQEHRLTVPTDAGDRLSPRGYNNGVQPVMTVCTREGISLTGTLNHKVKIMTDDGPTWRRLDELQAGDAVLVVLGQHLGQLRALRHPAKTHGNQADIGLPSILDETLAFVLGYLAGDGFVAAEEHDHRVGFSVAHNSYLVDELPNLLHQVFPGCTIHRQQKTGDASVTYVLDSTLIKRFLVDNGLAKAKSHEVAVPRLVRQSPANVAGAYLRGLFEADGGLSDGYPQLNTTSQRLAQEVGTLLIGLGSPVTVRSADYSGRLGKRPQWVVRIASHVGLEAWRRRVGCDPRSRFVACYAFRPDMERESSYALPAPAYWLQPVLDDITLPQIDRKGRGQGVHWRATAPQLRRKLLRYVHGGRSLTMSAYRELSAGYPEVAQHARPVQDLWFVHVAETQLAGEQLTLDLEVDGNHTYLANGLVTHNTRRGANMGVLRVDHPDVEEFIACKAKEGQIANFNISVGVTDAFMEAVQADGDFDLVNPHNKAVARTVRARDLFDKIAHYAHRNGEPGVLFLDAANRSNPVPHLYELEATNPCITGDTLVATPTGWRRADTIHEGDEICTVLGVGRVATVEVNQDMPVYELHLSDGAIIRATASHQFHARDSSTKFFEPCRLDQLKLGDWIRVYRSVLPNNPVRGKPVHLTDREYGFVVGVLVGDGVYTPHALSKNVVRISSHADEGGWNACIMQAFSKVGAEKMSTYVNAGSRSMMMDPKPGRVVAAWVKSLPLEPARGPEKRLPDEYINSNRDFLVGLLDGLFSTDGSVDLQSNHPLIRFHTSSNELAQQVRLILLMFGIHGRICTSVRKRHAINGRFIRNDRPKYDVVISGDSFGRFFEQIRLSHADKQNRMEQAALRSNFTGGNWAAKVVGIVPAGTATVYDLYEPKSDTWITEGYVSRGCGEQFLGPYENCCLGSINLAQHVAGDGKIDWAELEKTVVESTRFLDDVVSANKYVPAVPQLQDAAHRVRRIGLGIMGLADVMYRLGVRYGDQESLDLAGQVMEFVRYHCMRTSIDLARERGPFLAIEGSIYDPNNLKWQPPTPLQPYSHEFGRPAVDWDAIVDGIMANGIRNGAQCTVAPTGTIGTVTGCEGYGCEPVFALAYTRYVKEAGGDVTLTYVSPLFIEALDRAGITSESRERIVDQIVLSGTCQGVDELPQPLQHTFVVSQDITAEQHVLMQAALQRFVDNSISKCVIGDTLVLTSSGLTPISELSELRLDDQFETLALEVISPQGVEGTDAFYYGGHRETRRVRLEYGFQIEGTPNHCVQVLGEDGSVQFRRLDELKLGDVAVLYGGQRRFGPAGQPLPTFSGAFRGRSKPVAFPTHLTADFSFLLGSITSDGAITANGVVIANNDVELLTDLRAISEAQLGLTGTIVADPRNNVHTLQINSRPLRNWLLADLGLEAGAEHKIIPSCILRASQSEVAAFLRGLMLDGFMTADGKLFGITLASEKLIRQLQVLLLNMGVLATMRQTAERVWNLTVQGGELENLASQISFVEIWKNERLAERNAERLHRFRNYSRLLPATVTSALRTMQDTSERSLRSHYDQGSESGAKAYQRTRVNLLQGHRLERSDAQELYAHLCKNAADPFADSFFNHDQDCKVYVAIQSIESGFAEVFDISVPGSHSFIANGLGNHNTINCPPEATPGDIKQVYMQAWELGCKGLTVYVTGSRQEVVLETKATAEAKKATASDAPINGRASADETLEAAPYEVEASLGNSNGSHAATTQPEYVSYDVKRPRPKRLHGATYRRLTPLGTAYVTVNDTEEGEPFEVFMNVGKAGSDVAAVSEALGRLISLTLRMPSSLSPTERLQQVVYQLNGIGGGRHLGFGPQRVRSLPDAIAQVLAEHLEEAPLPAAPAEPPAEQLALPIPKQIGDLCPDCGNSTLLNIEGCRKCHVCGYSEC